MPNIYSKALNQEIDINRFIGKIEGTESGPTLIFIGGIHGNEPAGVFALHKVVEEIKEKNISVKGNFYALAGNLWALEQGKRYHKQDLNRLWNEMDITNLKNGYPEATNQDLKEQIELFDIINEILRKNEGPFYFMDLHTTSSETIPFLTVNDSLLNRKFTEKFPAPMILGIEEYLNGPLLSYINELGFVAFGYEGGQHDDIEAIENHISFIYLSLVFTGCIAKKDIDFESHYQSLEKRTREAKGVYEIYFRYEIRSDELFVMKPGYKNFQFIPKGNQLATSDGEAINALSDGRVFMPLYQNQGNDGFFAIKSVSPFILSLSALLRKWRFDNVFAILPGVKWASKKHDKLIVNRKIAKLFTKQIFHLMGYRARKINKTILSVKNREAAARYSEYKNENWF